MKVSEHLKARDVDHADNFTEAAKHFHKMHGHFAEVADHMKKADHSGGAAELADCVHGVAECCKALGDQCLGMGEKFAGHAKSVSETAKAFGLSDDALEPSPISAVAPDVPKSVHMVLRSGQQLVSKTAVPKEFQHLTAIPED
jgi:hypothetical protein